MRSWSTTLLRRSLLVFFCAGLLVTATTTPASAQDAASIISDVRSNYIEMFDGVDNYVMETDMHTTYYKRDASGGPLAFQTSTKLKGQSTPMGGQSVQNQYEQLDRVAEHGEYVGTETVNGVECYVIRVDDPAKVDPNMAPMNELRYFIGVDDSHIHRMNMTGEGGQQGLQGMTMNLKDYRTADGLTMPWIMEMQAEMSEAQRQQMQQLKQQMEQMPEQQRKRMEQMMGDQMKRMEAMAGGEPMVIRVQSIAVNTDLPDGIFE
jgi:hypothetical protein